MSGGILTAMRVLQLEAEIHQLKTDVRGFAVTLREWAVAAGGHAPSAIIASRLLELIDGVKGATRTGTEPDVVDRAEDLLTKLTQPGPWSVREDDVTPGGRDINCVVIDRDGMWVAECGHDPDNSAFIAAAPDLVRELAAEVKRLKAVR